MKRIYNTEYSIESLYDGFIASMVQKNLRSFCIPFLEGKISINNVETKLWKFYLEVGLKKTSPEDEMIFFENILGFCPQEMIDFIQSEIKFSSFTSIHRQRIFSTNDKTRSETRMLDDFRKSLSNYLISSIPLIWKIFFTIPNRIVVKDDIDFDPKFIDFDKNDEVLFNSPIRAISAKEKLKKQYEKIGLQSPEIVVKSFKQNREIGWYLVPDYITVEKFMVKDDNEPT